MLLVFGSVFYYRVASMQGGLIATKEMSVRPFIRLSNAWIVTKRKKFCPNFYTTWKNVDPSFPTWRMLGGAPCTPCTWNFGSKWPCSSTNAYFQSICARSTSVV